MGNNDPNTIIGKRGVLLLNSHERLTAELGYTFFNFFFFFFG